MHFCWHGYVGCDILNKKLLRLIRWINPILSIFGSRISVYKFRMNYLPSQIVFIPCCILSCNQAYGGDGSIEFSPRGMGVAEIRLDYCSQLILPDAGGGWHDWHIPLVF